jgi:predicted translin family RNA/ssDNA-binding protein
MESENPSVVEELRHKLERRNKEIARLHQELNEMKQSIAPMEETSGYGVVKKKKNKTPSCCHKGRWMMDKDSIEFMEYPDELKSNLRDQKQKRLEQIRANMKFILDTDNVEDSNGYWDCCGQTSYSAQGCGK